MDIDNEPQKHKRKNRVRAIINFLQGMAFTIFLIAVAVMIYLIVLYRTHFQPYTNYAIVFDAGSSHTEMFIYNWPADKSNGLGTTSSVNEYFVCPLSYVSTEDSNRPGETIKLKAISDFEQHLDLLDKYFESCLQQAVEKIPSGRHKFSPIFLGATAGMRLTRLRNSTRAHQILEKIREIFSTYPFQFVTARQVRILTGMEEAIDGWITTNILLENFKHRHSKTKILKNSEPTAHFDTNMVGVLDLGGASTQVTFTYVRNITARSIPTDYTTNITLFDTVYNPYAHSYLCWGKNEGLRRYRARLLNAALNVNKPNQLTTTSPIINDPCLPRGVNETLTTANIFHSPCTENEKVQFNNPFNFSTFIFVGNGNASQCRRRILKLFNTTRNDRTVSCTYKKEYCIFNHTFQPDIPSKIHFIGLSGYYYVFNNLAYRMSITNGSTIERYKIKDFSKEELDQRLVNVCETNYSIFYHQESMTPNNEQHKRGLCFDAWYVWLLLTYAIGFTNEDLKRLSFANTFPTGKVGWTLGYMINQTNYIPAEYRPKAIEKHRFISGLTVFIIIALIMFIFIIGTCYKYMRHAFCKQTHQVTKPNKDGYAQPQEQLLA